MHYLAFRNRRLNDMMGSLFVVWPLFVVLDHGYRPWHFAHHRWLGTDKDPEVSYYAAVRSYHGSVSWRKICLVFVTDMLGFGVRDLLLFIWTIAPNRGSTALVGPVIFWAALLAVGTYLHAMWIPLLWMASLVTGFWAVFRVRAWTEHADVPLVWRSGRSNVHRFSASWLGRYLFFPHNTHCHYEHHQWPQVPYYNLQAAREFRNSRPVTPLPLLFPWKRDAPHATAAQEEPAL